MVLNIIFKFIIFTFVLWLILKLEYEKNINEKFMNKERIINEKHKENKKKKSIAVSFATDNKYIYPTIVSLASLVINASINTFYNIYILHTPDFSDNSKHFLKSIEDKYSYICQINFINMENKYKDLPLNDQKAIPTYYRLSLQDLLPEVDKIIYLDGDTLIFEDLKELIEIEMKENLILGFLDSVPDAIHNFGFKNPTVLNAGVLLMDLNGLRKYNFSQKIVDFFSKYPNNITQHDQTIINVVLQDKIAPIPPKYGIWAWNTNQEAIEHLEKQWPKLKYNKKDFYDAIKHPAIVHYVWPKPFWRFVTKYYDKWWNYARSTGYFFQIYFNSPQL